MAYPSSLDDSSSLPNPTGASTQASPDHAALHTAENDAIRALEAKLGTGASTPTSGYFLVGTGSGTSAWTKAVPSGAVVGDTDTQTLTNKSLTSPTITGSGTAAFNTVTAGTFTGTGSSTISTLTVGTTLTMPDNTVTTAKILNANVTEEKLTHRPSEYVFDHIASGCVWSGDSYGSTRVASCTSGVVYLSGKRLTVAAVTSRTFTASKDVYCDLHDNGDGTAVWVYTDNTTNAASPALTAGNLRGAIVVVGASNIANAAAINQGQTDKVLPIASSIAYTTTDSLGNLICPRDPYRKVLGYRQITSDFSSTTIAGIDVTGLSVPVITAGERIEVLLVSRGTYKSGAATENLIVSVRCDGTTICDKDLTIAGSGWRMSQDVCTFHTPAAGSHTYTARLSSSNTGNMALLASSTSPAFLVVKRA